MSKETKNKIVPELRFPEFKGSGEWLIKILGDVFKFKQGVQCPVEEQSQSESEGWVRFIRIVDLTKNDEPVRYIRNPGYEHAIYEDDLFMVRYGNPGVVGYNFKGVIANNLFRIIPQHKKNIHNKFYYFVLNHLQANILAMAGSSTMPALNFTTLSNLNIPCTSLIEQQKIADCLSSLDELITAQSQKLEALKAHKKGLMQQLFPAEGETVPQLRFAEFRDSGEWEEKTFNEYIEVVDGDRGINYPKTEDFSSKGYCLFLNAKNVTKEGFVFKEIQFINKEKDELLRKGKLKKLDIVLTTRGSLGQFAFYTENIQFDHLRINSGMVILRINDKVIDAKYFYSYCNSNIVQSTIKTNAYGNAVQQLTVGMINNFPLYFPKDLQEQQKIANCLSSIDELITAQTEKIEALKMHKKGLMQGLFPNVKETDIKEAD